MTLPRRGEDTDFHGFVLWLVDLFKKIGVTHIFLLHYSNIQSQNQPRRIVRKLVRIAKKGDVVPKFIKITLVANISRKSAGTQAQSRLPAPGKFFPASGIAVEVGQFRIAVQKIVANRATMQANWSGRKADQNRDIQVLVFFGADYFHGGSFSNFEIRPVGVKYQFRLDKNAVSDPDPGAELGAELKVVHPKTKRGVAAADNNIARVFQNSLKTAFQTKSNLRLQSNGAKQKQGYYNYVFHTCSDFVAPKTAAAQNSYGPKQNT